MLKNGLKKILPPPVSSFMREVHNILNGIDENKLLSQQLLQKIEDQEYKLQELDKKLAEEHEWRVKSEAEQTMLLERCMSLIETQQIRLQEDQHQNIEQQKALLKNQELTLQENQKVQLKMNEQQEQLKTLRQSQEQIKQDAHAARSHALQGKKAADEVLWAEIFNNTISGSAWLTNKAFSAGRWAVGYQYLYVVYRILNEVKPKKILELGLGQSTRLISQYAASAPDCNHVVVEHDPEWIDFFCNDFAVLDHTKMVELQRERKVFREDENVLCFAKFAEAFKNQTFDFISIDAPYGGGANMYARLDIVELLPQCLEESFVIVLDDYNRTGEQNTAKVIREKLEESNIKYKTGVYSGEKDCIVFCSEDLRFICSM